MTTATPIRTKNIEDYLREPYSRILIPEDEGGYSAEILEFPGCYSYGDTAEEAISNLEEAAKSWIAASLEQGHTIPPPTGHNEFSGKIALRLPSSLHKEAARMAERERVSLNQFLVSAVAAKVGAEDYHNRLIQRLEGYLITLTRVEETKADRRLRVELAGKDEIVSFELSGISNADTASSHGSTLRM